MRFFENQEKVDALISTNSAMARSFDIVVIKAREEYPETRRVVECLLLLKILL